MFKSIPASQIVSITPAVLSAGGSSLSMNAVFLSDNANLPQDKAIAFATAESVGSYFGLNSNEYKAAAVYFSGFDNSSIKPGTLYFQGCQSTATSAFLLGSSLASMEIEDLKKVSGTIALTVDGAKVSASSFDLSSVTSFSEAAQLIQSKLTNVLVEFDTQLQAFKFKSSSSGASSTINFASGAMATALKLTEATGATTSQGSEVKTPAEIMATVTASTLNWATFTTIFETDLATKMAYAEWTNAQYQRFLYVGWGFEENATKTGNTNNLGAKLLESEYNGSVALYGGLDKAAFVCGTIASIDFTERQGRITLKFKGQSGLKADVTDATIAQNLEKNGYNYYGAWATANDRFLFFSPGQIAGKWKWIDAYINQIRINSQLQLALMTMLTTVKSVPYNATGVALQRAACNDPINEALNFGSIQTGVTLSELQKATINNEAGFDVAAQIEAAGYYLYIGTATAQTRGQRNSMPMKFWYTDGGSVHGIDLPSINIQ